MAEMISIHPDNPQDRLIRKAVEVLSNGGIIAYPTDTVYGVGCDIFCKQSIDKIFFLKGRVKTSPLSFICPDLKDISKYAYVSNQAYKVMRQLLPGPYTFILKGTRVVPKLMITKRKTVGIRIPDNKICIALLKMLGHPIVSTSATLKNNTIINDPADIYSHIGHALDIIIDGGVLGMTPSSVVDLTDEPFRILRNGKGDISIFQ